MRSNNVADRPNDWEVFCDGINTLYTERYARSVFLYRYMFVQKSTLFLRLVLEGRDDTNHCSMVFHMILN